AGAGRRDRVVAARVADRRQRVVLAHDRDGGALAGLDRRAKRGLDSGDAALDLEALSCEEFGQPGGGLDFLVTELGIVVDPVRELLEVVTEAVDRGGDRVFEGGHVDSPGVRNRACSTGAPLYHRAFDERGIRASSTRKRLGWRRRSRQLFSRPSIGTGRIVSSPTRRPVMWRTSPATVNEPSSSLIMTSIQQILPSVSAVVGATVTHSPLRLASSARPRRRYT